MLIYNEPKFSTGCIALRIINAIKSTKINGLGINELRDYLRISSQHHARTAHYTMDKKENHSISRSLSRGRLNKGQARRGHKRITNFIKNSSDNLQLGSRIGSAMVKTGISKARVYRKNKNKEQLFLLGKRQIFSR